jgi:outer membrane cobalamin receptor
MLGFGSFLTREEMEKQRDRPLGEILTRLPGVRYNRYGSEGAIASHRGGRARGGDSFDRRKGAPPGCYAQVYLDGIRIFSASAGEPLFNINSLEPSSIQGIEYYAGAAQTPMQFNPTNAECGTVVIWTRIE